MARVIEKLSEMQVRQAKPRAAPYKLSDVGGLFLLVKSDGARYWRYNYRFAGLQKTMALAHMTTWASRTLGRLTRKPATSWLSAPTQWASGGRTS